MKTDPAETLSREAVSVLRACHLPVGAAFVRCGRDMGVDAAYRIAAELREALGDSRDDVFAAFNAETGHNDYVRVNRGSEAFAFVCRMKA